MGEAWFAPQMAQYFSLAGALSFTAFAVPMIVRGKGRAAVVTIWSVIIAAGAALACAGAYAFWSGQPSHVTAPLFFTGAVVAAAYSVSLVFVSRIYRLAERRKMAARDL